MIKDIAIASIFQRVMAQEFVKGAGGTQIFATVVDAVCVAGIHHKLNYLLNMMNLSYYQLLKTGMHSIKQEIQRKVFNAKVRREEDQKR